MALGKRSSKRPLQEVLGQGANVNAGNPLEVHDPKVGSLISYEGTTTADGAGDGSTLTDLGLTAKPDYNGNLVIITSGAYAGQARDINGVTTGGTVTPHLAFDGQILRGTNFVIAAIRLTPAEVAALVATLGALNTAAATGAVSNVKAAMAYLKQLVTGLALDGSAPFSFDYTKATVPGWLHGFHMVRRILFVVPEAIGSITVHNTAIRDELVKMGLVITITQADAPTYPDYESITLTVLGSPLAGIAWNTANLVHIKAIFGLPVVCVDALTAVYLKMGTDGGNALTKTELNAIANIEGSILGAGIDDTVGLAPAANTVADAPGVTFSTLDMSDGNITEIWYGWETTEDETDVLLGEIRKTMPDATPGKDIDGADVPGTLAFYGCAYSMNGLNTLGKAVLHLLVEKLLHSSTAGLAVILSGEIGNLAATIGNRATPAADGPVTNADFLMAYVKQLVTELIVVDGIVDTLATDTDPLVMGRAQVAPTIIDLGQAAGTYDLFTANTQDVVVEKFVIRMSGGTLVGSNLTSILIQTDDATPIVLIDTTAGDVANLTDEAQLAWTGAILLDAGTSAKIQCVIAGGVATVAKVCDVIAEYRAVVAGGYLA
ncbi:hypothetical protein ES703_38298 [subsurface metagenome]